jgi:hypothetical protein
VALDKYSPRFFGFPANHHHHFSILTYHRPMMYKITPMSGRVIAYAVSRRLTTAAARVPDHVR